MSCLKIYFLPLDLPFFRRIFPFCEFRKEASSLIHLGLFCTGKICTIHSAQRLLIKSFTGMCCGPFVQFPPTRKHRLFQDFVLFLPLVSVCGTACSLLQWAVQQSLSNSAQRHLKYPGFVSAKLGEAQTCTVHHKVKVLGACPTVF